MDWMSRTHRTESEERVSEDGTAAEPRAPGRFAPEPRSGDALRAHLESAPSSPLQCKGLDLALDSTSGGETSSPGTSRDDETAAHVPGGGVPASYAASIRGAFAAGGGAPIQARLTQRGEALAAAWQRDVLAEVTLPHSQAFGETARMIQALHGNAMEPEAGDRALLALLSSYQLPPPDPGAIFEDAAPGEVAMQRIGDAHRRLLAELGQHIQFGAIDEYVEGELRRTAGVLGQNNDQARAIRAVRGGSLTSMRDPSGDLSPSLNTESRAQKLHLVEAFNQFTEGRAQPPAPKGIVLYRRVKGEHLKALRNGATFDEIVPFSASWSRSFAEDWSPGEGLIFEIDVPMSYPMLFQARRPGAQVPQDGPVPLNQDQAEVTLVQSRLTLLEDPRRVRDGQQRENFVVRATATPLGTAIAQRQHEAMELMNDDDRVFVNAQQRDEDPVAPNAGQREIDDGLAQLGGARAALMTLAQGATTERLLAIGALVGTFANQHQPALGPVTSVLRAFSTLGAGDQPLLQMLLRRVFNPQYYTGTDARFTPARVLELLRLLLPRMATALGGQLQLKMTGGGGAIPDTPAPIGGGSALPDALRAQMEQAFAADFSDVRVHEGAHVSALGALAYAQGSGLHFAPGQYAPDSEAGRELIGHELAHVVQQRAGRVAGGDGGVNRDASLEAEADAAGAKAARGVAPGLAGGEARGTSGAVKQRKLVAEDEPSQRIRDLLRTYSSRRTDLGAIANSDTFDFVFLPAVEPPDQLRGVSGWTRAILKDSDGGVIATIGSSEQARGLGKNVLMRLARMEVEIWGFTLETSEATGDVVAASTIGQTLTMIHEVERHALPFYDLFNDVMMARFQDEVGGGGHVDAIVDDLQMERRGHAVLQHADPALAANTVITTLGYAATLDAAAKAEALLRLYMDNIHRGVALDALRQRYVPTHGETEIWRAFADLCTKLSSARRGEPNQALAPGRRVIVLAGFYTGREGTVDRLAVPDEEREHDDEVLVEIDGTHSLVAFRPLDCFVLA